MLWFAAALALCTQTHSSQMALMRLIDNATLWKGPGSPGRTLASVPGKAVELGWLERASIRTVVYADYRPWQADGS